ncbi:hypothetical protein DPMN_045843 [Dreissena polymorpha]|uniref:Uncharacterized protein n=1 Tax=Dreissena polymorpha TaxID=45954 RepID=A0A9D4I1R3_DREPO|nr:hypothetical protein DPMN_045843 [Dreissena polymorpha]
MQFRWSKTIQFRSRPFDVPLPRVKDHKLCPVKAIFTPLSLPARLMQMGPPLSLALMDC